jgi:Arc/MetJ-type ribon-helix-helix transcriptional regulator
MAQRAIRFSEATDKGIREAAEKRRFSSPTAFIRHAVEQELAGRQDELVNAEGRLAASIEQVRQTVLPVARTQQALFALVDTGQDSTDLYSRAGRIRAGSRRRQSTK